MNLKLFSLAYGWNACQEYNRLRDIFRRYRGPARPDRKVLVNFEALAKSVAIVFILRFSMPVMVQVSVHHKPQLTVRGRRKTADTQGPDGLSHFRVKRLQDRFESGQQLGQVAK